MLKKKITFYLALFMLFQSVFASANIFFKIVEVVEDFQIHQVKYGDNLTDFLSKHFGKLKESHKEQHQKEHQEHRHPHLDILSNLAFEFIQNSNPISLKMNRFVKFKKPDFHYRDRFSTFEKQKIFQPPRLA